MSEISYCPKCGAELADNALAGICPKCLLAAGLESESKAQPHTDPQAPTIDNPAASGFIPPAVSELADKFPQLEILGLLGFGGMGAVYKARQTNLDRLVALKIIRPQATHDPTFAERFNREAKVLARLSHQHIVTIHDFGEVEFSDVTSAASRPLYFFVMEYVDGADLRQLMQAGELTPEQALAIVPQICDALQYAHDEGVVHRDIKPENILLDRRGRVKIADYGLAKLASVSDADFTLTGTHQVMGTVRYMAPEQMEASHTVDHRADIYSLGVVFYEMLTGEIPAGHFDPPSRKVVLDVRLDEVVMRSLARDPERRYQHASDVKTDVELCGTASPVSSATNTRRDVQDGNHASSSAASFGTWFSWREYSGYAVVLLFLMLVLCKSVFQQPLSLTGSIGILMSVAILSLLAYAWESWPFVSALPWHHRRNWTPVVAPFLMLFFLAVYFDRESVAAWYRLSGETASDADGLLQRIAYFGLNVWTFLFISFSAHRHPLKSAIRGLWRHDSKPLANDEEQQREAELAEIAPDWICGPILGLFAAGWIVVGLLWNLRWPGLIVAIGVMTAITYYVVQLLLRYLPTLRHELERAPRWSRVVSLCSALLMFVLGMLCVVWLQATIGDLLINVQMYGSHRGLGFNMMNQKQLATFVEAANLEGLSGANAGFDSAGFGWRYPALDLLLAGAWGSCLLFFSVASSLHTRRYRYTWKHWWQPSIEITFYLLGTLIVVHVLHLFVSGGHSESHTDPRRIRIAAGWDAVDTALDNWKQENGYVQSSFENWKVNKDGVEIGALHARQLMPDSWFDRYQSSWRHIVVRPQPALSLTIVSQQEPPQSFVEVQLPHATTGSTEKESWYVLVDELEATLVSAAKLEKNSVDLVAANKDDDQTSTVNDDSNGLDNDANSD